MAEGGDSFCADLSAETLRRCAPWREGAKVNLEKPLRAGDFIGGHFVGGHIDGIAEVVAVAEDGGGGGGKVFRIAPPSALLPLIAEKGSVALAGISLTVGEVGDGVFAVYAIPHTLQTTTAGEWTAGQKINMEADMLARYCARA